MAGTPKGKDMGGLETRCSVRSLYQEELDPQTAPSPPLAKQLPLSDCERRLEFYSLETLSREMCTRPPVGGEGRRALMITGQLPRARWDPRPSLVGSMPMTPWPGPSFCKPYPQTQAQSFLRLYTKRDDESSYT